MNQPFDRFLMFENRLLKVYRHLGKMARRQGVTCFRIYDHDMPEFPFLIERYENSLYVSEYKRHHSLSDEEHEAWLESCKAIMHKVTGVAPDEIYLKLRQRKESRQDQYKKLAATKSEFPVGENGLQFLVNLTDYLDSGLFLDHRITRQMVRDISKGKRVLNLFCYTGSFSVYALAGGAEQVISVDLSKTYLDWTSRNFELNFPMNWEHEEVHADVLKFLKDEKPASFDIIVLDPPTFSNSKRMDDILDVQRDHVMLINNCLRLLRPGGVLFFSTNYRKFKLAAGVLHSKNIKDITRATTPFDFEGRLHRLCYRIEKL